MLDKLKRQAKALKRGFDAGDLDAAARVRAILPDIRDLCHADALHVIAVEQGATSWPKLKLTLETAQMNREQQAERLRIAVLHGQHWVVEALLSETPELARHDLGLACALYQTGYIRDALARDPAAATRPVQGRSPMVHLCFSRHIHGAGDTADMLGTADILRQTGADVNDHHNHEGDPNAPLSVLYGAVGHGDNMALAEWLLDHGANPNDGESLYHSTELGHHRGLALLLKHGADPKGTNALLRALDFNDHTAVRMLLDAGADPNEGVVPHVSGEPPWVIPALHQAARRMCDTRMVQMLVQAGADVTQTFEGVTPYAMARVYGNQDAAQVLGPEELTQDQALLAAAADGAVPQGRYVDPARLPEEFRNLIRTILHLPGTLDHVKRLVAIGLEYDRPDPMGLTPVQIAGWEGLPEVMGYFLGLKPDLSHINGYGGTLLSTIIHGSENCTATGRDHIACARLALTQGVALPKRAIALAGREDMAKFLTQWAQDRPGQVVADGVG